MSANLLNNKIGVEQAQNLATILKDHATLESLCGNKGDETELDLSGKEMDAGSVIMLAPEVIANGALTRLDLSKNKMLTREAGEAIGDMLKDNRVLTDLDVSRNLDFMAGSSNAVGFVEGIADGLIANVTLVKFDISRNMLLAAGTCALAKALKGNQILKELNISANFMGWSNLACSPNQSGVVAICDAISTMRALTSVNISNNNMLTAEAGKALAGALGALAAHSVLKKLDVSDNNYRWNLQPSLGQWMGDGPGFARALAVGLGKLEKLQSRNNNVPKDLQALFIATKWLRFELRGIPTSLNKRRNQ